jgi:predicted N-formylglutamate amidohydrolase
MSGGTTLLAAGEPAPFRVLRRDGSAEIVLTADHAGRLIPRSLGTLGLTDADLARHIAWDIGIAGVTERLSALLDAPAILQTYSRLVIDCNRTPGMPTSIPQLSEATTIPGNLDVTPGEAAARRDAIFAPYHDEITRLLDRRAAGGRRTILVAMHSFTPIYLGEVRTVEVGVLYNRDPSYPSILLDLLRAEGDLTVGDNEPYSVGDLSDYGIPVHGERRGLPHAEIEIRQDLIESEAGQRAWAERMARLLTEAARRLTAG